MFVPPCRCQQKILNELQLDDNIAHNQALCENVFMMVVCIELRIPLFIVGKPGSSKSLAKTIIQDNMQGNMAKSELFKKFKQVKMHLMVPFQCIDQQGYSETQLKGTPWGPTFLSPLDRCPLQTGQAYETLTVKMKFWGQIFCLFRQVSALEHACFRQVLLYF